MAGTAGGREVIYREYKTTQKCPGTEDNSLAPDSPIRGDKVAATWLR